MEAKGTRVRSKDKIKRRVDQTDDGLKECHVGQDIVPRKKSHR